MAFKKKFPYKAALVACNGSCGATREEPKCAYGCLGCGACVSACKFGAIHLSDNGVADVDGSCIFTNSFSSNSILP